MLIKKKVIIPAVPEKEEKKVVQIKCELCGKETEKEHFNSKWNGTNWLEDNYENNYNHTFTSIKCGEGYNYPGDGGSTDWEILDICYKCFRTKLIPWFKSQGGKVRTEDEDH